MPEHVRYNLFIGRWQPFHDGHEKLIRTVLNEGKAVLVAVRETPRDDQNPYGYDEVEAAIRERFTGEFGTRLRVISIPDIEAVCIGRKVGYDIREIRLDESTEAVSGTSIREMLRNEGAL